MKTLYPNRFKVLLMLIKPQIRMKKFTLFLFFIGGLVSMQAQDRTSTHSINDTHKGLILKLGLNLVDSSGGQNPFEFLSIFDEMAFSENYNIELEYRFSNSFSLSAGWSRNKWKANKGRIDNSIVSSDIKYSAIDVDLKYYYDEAFGGWFDRNDWFDLYLHGGVGSVSQHDNTSMSMNAGLGSNVWFSERFGFNFNGSAKFFPESGDNLLSSNHFQYSASLMYRFGSNDKNKDDDNDGVKNKDDDCPNVAGVADNNGCPEEVNDSDGDGIPDAIDNCPNEYGTENGCPKEEETEMIVEVDTDGDSVIDSEDNCPNVKGLPTNNGCPPPDSDNDGIIDLEDKCPTVPGIVANNGCPFEEIKVGTADTSLNRKFREILFDSENPNFRQDSYPILMKVAEMLKQHPEAKFKIEGHADSTGSYVFNKRLSQTRANAVRSYLISTGIPSENLVTEGFGETKPIASNLTKEGRRLNRRVEIIRIK